MIGASWATTSPMPLRIFPIRGTMFPAAVDTLSTRLSMSVPRSAVSSPTPVSRFFHAALAMLKLPEIVLAASLAVVPVMPISV